MTSDSNFRALRRGAVASLTETLREATTADDFLAAAEVIVANPANQLRLPIEPQPSDELHAGPAGSKGRDVNNAQRVYECLGALDRANASDGRLWTYLAFSTFRPYMEERWPLNVPSWKNRVTDRWLLTGSSRGKLVRHGISRLWWVADLTFDGGCQFPLSALTGDEFAYANATLKNEDRVLALFDREAGAIPSLVRVILEHAESSPDRGTDQQVRRLMKDVTLVYGFRDIEVLDEDRLRELISSLAANYSLE